MSAASLFMVLVGQNKPRRYQPDASHVEPSTTIATMVTLPADGAYMRSKEITSRPVICVSSKDRCTSCSVLSQITVGSASEDGV
ncbi:hypothetical protein ACROYT_G012559 [Oculina patagonica]